MARPSTAIVGALERLRSLSEAEASQLRANLPYLKRRVLAAARNSTSTRIDATFLELAGMANPTTARLYLLATAEALTASPGQELYQKALACGKYRRFVDGLNPKARALLMAIAANPELPLLLQAAQAGMKLHTAERLVRQMLAKLGRPGRMRSAKEVAKLLGLEAA